MPSTLPRDDRAAASSATLTTMSGQRDFLTAIYNATTNKWYVLDFVKRF
ncbi:hypothetical protein ABTZ58_33685 [Streptomyces sp. NPDC094143]